MEKGCCTSKSKTVKSSTLLNYYKFAVWVRQRIWIPNVDPEMENAVKKHSAMHNEFYFVVKGTATRKGGGEEEEERKERKEEEEEEDEEEDDDHNDGGIPRSRMVAARLEAVGRCCDDLHAW